MSSPSPPYFWHVYHNLYVSSNNNSCSDCDYGYGLDCDCDCDRDWLSDFDSGSVSKNCCWPQAQHVHMESRKAVNRLTTWPELSSSMWT